MTIKNKCNHALEIAEDMYNAYADGKDRYKRQPMVKYADLPDDDKAAWLNVAEQALPIIGRHALGDIRDYLLEQAKTASGWGKWLYWAGVGIAGAVLGALGMSLTGCGHSVDVTPGKTAICKDGSCLVFDKDSKSITYRQNAPEPPASKAQTPVVMKQKK